MSKLVEESNEASLLIGPWHAVRWYLERYDVARSTLQLVFENHAHSYDRIAPNVALYGAPPTLGNELRAFAPVGDTPEVWEIAGVIRALASWTDEFEGLGHAMEVGGVMVVRQLDWEQRRDDWYIQKRG